MEKNSRNLQKNDRRWRLSLSLGLGVLLSAAALVPNATYAQSTYGGTSILDVIAGNTFSANASVQSKTEVSPGQKATYHTSGPFTFAINCAENNGSYKIQQVISSSAANWGSNGSVGLPANSQTQQAEVTVPADTFQVQPEFATTVATADGAVVTLQAPTAGVLAGKCFIQQPVSPNVETFETLLSQFGAVKTQVAQLSADVKELEAGAPVPTASGTPIPNSEIDSLEQKVTELEKRPAGGADEETKKQVSDLAGKVAELEKRPTSPATPVTSTDPATQQQIEALRTQVERLQQNKLTDEDTTPEQAGQIAEQSATGPYPAPEQVVPAVNRSGGGGVAEQIQNAGPSTALGLSTSDGTMISNASGKESFELRTAEPVKDKNLLVVKNGPDAKFVIDTNGKITSQSVGTTALENKAVTSAKLNPGRVDYRVAAGDDVQVNSGQFTDVGNGYEYQSGGTAEVLILNGRLMAKNEGGQGVGVRLVAEIDGKTVECNESFSYDADWSTLSVPCTIDVPASKKITIKWQARTDGGTAQIFRQNDKAAPYVNGFATAK